MEFAALDVWERSIRSNLDNHRFEVECRFVLQNRDAFLRLAKLNLPEFFEEVLTKFVQEDILGPDGVATKNFAKVLANPSAFSPKLAEENEDMRTLFKARDASSRTVDPGERAAEDLRKQQKVRDVNKTGRLGSRAMFTTVWNDFIAGGVKHGVVGSIAWAGVGDKQRMLDRQLQPYMAATGRVSDRPASDMNSLFLAVEYGTGVAANVGGAQNVRTSGKTKEPTLPGAWWFGQQRGQGTLFKGQKGVHFLFEERSRLPLPAYRRALRENLPQLVAIALNDKSIGAGASLYTQGIG